MNTSRIASHRIVIVSHRVVSCRIVSHRVVMTHRINQATEAICLLCSVLLSSPINVTVDVLKAR